MTEITLNSPFDMHLHLRDDDMLKLVAPLTSSTFAGAIIMPNLVPPLSTKNEVVEYKNRILKATKGDDFTPFMTLFFKAYTKEFLGYNERKVGLTKIIKVNAKTSIGIYKGKARIGYIIRRKK